MVYDSNSREGYRADSQDYGRVPGRDSDYSYSSAREYEAAGLYGDDGRGRGGFGRSDRGRGGYGREQYGREQFGRSGGGRGYYGGGDYDRQSYGARDYGNDRYARRDQYGQASQGPAYHGSYAGDGRPFEDVGRHRHADDDYYRSRPQQRGYGRQPQGYQYEDRGFFERAGDEVRSWFGDEEAERRRDMDQRYDERSDRYGNRDDDYHSWRAGQVAALDRDYDEYRRENRSRFHDEFSTWRTGRQGQRDQLKSVKEHQEVVGSDGSHVGTVDKVKGDRILLTKNDKDAGGQHHSIPSSWITSVDDKVTLNKSADEAKRMWQDEDRSSAMFGYGDNARGGRTAGGNDDRGSGANLDRSFSGTY